MTVRLERPADYRETELVVREAFWNCYSPGCMEHYLLHVMRDSPGFVPELDFVAESGNRIIGSAAAVFDRQFPYKVPVSGTPSQRRFEEVSSMQKDYITKSA